MPYISFKGKSYVVLGVSDDDKLYQFGESDTLESSFELYNRQTYGVMNENHNMVKPTALLFNDNNEIAIFILYSKFPTRFIHQYREKPKKPGMFKDIAVIGYSLLRKGNLSNLSDRLKSYLNYLPESL
jgi:hypothetical protein